MLAPFPSRRALSRFLSLFAVLLVVAGSARAGEIKFPADGSSVLLTLPDGWKTSEETTGA